jgi:hypothetical protein
MQADAIVHLKKIICSSDTYSEDILAVCLLTYGNYLLTLQKLQIRENVSDEIQNVLNILFETSPTEIISIRAGVCFILPQYSTITFDRIWNWFRNKPNIISKTTCNILLQLTLYKMHAELSDPHLDAITDLIGTFIVELYNYLCNKDNSGYLVEPTPDYLNVARRISKRNFDTFRKGIQRSSVGEENFKRAICSYFYQRSKQTDYETLVMIYAMFGILTVDLINMMECIDYYWDNEMPYYLTKIKHVSDSDVIEKIFQLLDYKASHSQFKGFSNILNLMVQLAEAHTVSLLEVHQRVSIIINNWLYQDDTTGWNREKSIFCHLTDLSCIENERFWTLEEKLLTESDIDSEFERELENVEKKSALFLRRNYLFDILRSFSNNCKNEDHSVLVSNSSGESRKLVRRWRFVEGAVITIKKRFSKRIREARTSFFSFLSRKN